MLSKMEPFVRVPIVFFLFIFGTYYFLVFIGNIGAELGVIPVIETREFIESEGPSVYPWWFDIINSALLFPLATLGIVFYKKKFNWIFLLCGLSIAFWLLLLFWDKNAFTILSTWQIKSYFTQRLLDLFLIGIVFGRQLLLYRRSNQSRG